MDDFLVLEVVVIFFVVIIPAVGALVFPSPSLSSWSSLHKTFHSQGQWAAEKPPLTPFPATVQGKK
jgi:hypothetical protein